MKIEGTIHIFGMNEVLFRQKYRGQFYVIVQYLRAITQDKWVRVLGDEVDGFYRTDDSMIHSIKSLAFNPEVKLSYNDGIMFVDFLHETLTDREWRRLEKFMDANKDDFKIRLEEMIRS